MSEKALRVHVTLREAGDSGAGGRGEILERIVSATGLAGVNEKRFLKYGVLTGDIDPNRLDLLSTLDVVQSVEVDQERYATY